MLNARQPSRPGVVVLPSELGAKLAGYGLRVRGAFAPDPAMDIDLLQHAPWTKAVILVGNVGAELWEASTDRIAAISGPDPLDRWTQQTVDPIARALGGVALYPFSGPPYWPFQRWAERAEGVRPSPLGIFIHPEYGLWHAYRAAILAPVAVSLPTPAKGEHPCDTCADRPCLTHCPVNAFSEQGYDVENCIDYVVARQSEAGACRDIGCLARLACPVGVRWRYRADQGRFHMDAFIRARLAARDAKS